MKKILIVLAAIATVVVVVITSIYFFSPLAFLFFGISGVTSSVNVKIDIDSYRLCEDSDGKDVIIIKYLLKNNGKEPTALYYEGDFYVYQDGVGLTEYTDKLPKECDYNPDDQYKNIKGGVEYFAEIAYLLEYPDKDVEVEVDDYGLFEDKKEKVFKIK